MKRIIALLFIMVLLLSACVVENQDIAGNSGIDNTVTSQSDDGTTMIHIDWVIFDSAAELVANADVMLIGTVTGESYKIHETKSVGSNISPYTEYTVEVKTVYKGEVKNKVTVNILGIPQDARDEYENSGKYDKIPIIDRTPKIDIGETYLFSLKERKNIGLEAITFYQGALNIHKENKDDTLPSIREIVSYFGKEELSAYEQLQHNTATYIFKIADTISLRSLEQLEKMRQMAKYKDGEEFNSYLRSVEGGGAKSRLDLVEFLKLIDSLPVLKFIDGTVSWISHETGNSIDTSDYYDVVYVSTEAENGDWTRIEYLLSYDDVPAEMQKRKEKGEFVNSTLKNPTQSKDGKIKVYAETRKKHPSGTGDLINWILDVDGIFVWVFYYTNNVDSVKTEDIFDKVNIINIADIVDSLPLPTR